MRKIVVLKNFGINHSKAASMVSSSIDFFHLLPFSSHLGISMKKVVFVFDFLILAIFLPQYDKNKLSMSSSVRSLLLMTLEKVFFFLAENLLILCNVAISSSSYIFVSLSVFFCKTFQA